MATTEQNIVGGELAARAARVIPGGVNSGQRQVPGLEELVIAATKGATFTDGQGRTYTDYHAAFGPPILGHNDPDVDAAVASTAKSVGLMGVGVTEVEVELAERLCSLIPSVERVLLTETGSEATFHAIRVARAATGRRHVIKFQGCYHGWHDSVAMNVISPAERVGQKDPLSKGSIPDVIDATIVCKFNDADEVERALVDHDVAAIILEPIPHNIGAVLPLPGFLERLRELATKHGTVLIFDEVVTGLPPRARRLPVDRRRHARPDDDGQGDGQRLADLRARREGRADGHVQHDARKSRVLRRNVQRPSADHRRGARNDRQAAARAGARARLRPRRAHPPGPSRAVRAPRRHGHVSGFGSIFVTYFLEGTPTSYDDLLANDVDLFTGYRRELMNHGIFELPLNLKRSHFSWAHTDEDVDRLLEATEEAVQTVLARRA